MIRWVIWISRGEPLTAMLRHHGNPWQAIAAPGVFAVSAPNTSARKDANGGTPRASGASVPGWDRPRAKSTGADNDDYQHGEQRHRDCQVSHDNDRTKRQLHRHRSKNSGGDDQHQCEQCRSQSTAGSIDARLRALAEGNYNECDDRNGQRCGTVTMRDLNQQRRRVVHRREGAVAIRPMIAAPQARPCDPHYRAENDLRKSDQQRDVANAPNRLHSVPKVGAGVTGIGIECCICE